MTAKDHLLSNEYYYGSDKMLFAVDNIIFGFSPTEQKLKILLFKRLIEPFAGQWSLIGSFVKENESSDSAAIRVLKELTALTGIFLEQLKCYSLPKRDPGSRVVSIAYYSLIQISEQTDNPINIHNGQWVDVDSLPALVMDHNTMVSDALERLRAESKHKPIGFELLPKTFTLPLLLKLYQEIHQQQLDDRNFRKKILSMNLLIKLDQKDKSSSKKGAYLYQFDKKKYNVLIEKGFDFEL